MSGAGKMQERAPRLPLRGRLDARAPRGSFVFGRGGAGNVEGRGCGSSLLTTAKGPAAY